MAAEAGDHARIVDRGNVVAKLKDQIAIRRQQDYAGRGMPAYVDLQEQEFERESSGYTATRQRI